MAFKPKGKSHQPPTWGFGLPPLNNMKKSLGRKRKCVKWSAGLGVVFFVVFIILHGFPGSKRNPETSIVPAHGYYVNEVPASSQLIFPTVEHTPILKDMGIRSLFILRMEVDGSKRYVYKPNDVPLPDEEKKKIMSQETLAKRAFLDHGKLVYRRENELKTVIVSLIDFENEDLDSIIAVVQNRVDYAQKHNYGVYIRWIQEFIPILAEQDLSRSGEFCKLLVMRAAMHAFPNAENFLFVDNKSLIMNLKLSVERDILNPSTLDLTLKRDVSVSTNSPIKTYTNLDLKSVKLIIPQNNRGELDISSFLVKNSVQSKAFLEYVSDPLIRDFDGISISEAISHVLQWHPELLSRTAIVISKLMSSEYDAETLLDENQNSFHYSKGDFVAHFKDCAVKGTCNADITNLYNKLQHNPSS
ncbi:alpha-1,6-mannosyltransferase KNAG_0C02300 [Huiozyma naganishii CBS 8797]|uniref:Uncharacterized protein n=1 Tax=Huiozyma naganishii (strain ATCC MYA-139 / BCRC 22969 / CBS 8797 / KCTC 17520 / NBRC 10181 / NCYC 3082 / Yp74L-3) TaxID=1071383 RepID=J7S5R9_HUIN7|nr:hypothetical protein KNAG_0C02300 [Kazachstania naganishii CBS 8797]CCK69341.1 hypothetical protein KNAG_0C02300 [Kazachstania naganishii CBS 8797]